MVCLDHVIDRYPGQRYRAALKATADLVTQLANPGVLDCVIASDLVNCVFAVAGYLVDADT